MRHVAYLAAATLLAGTARANHLAGPMQDRMGACMKKHCPDFNTFNNAPNFNGLGVPFATFITPPMNAVPFIYDMPYMMKVIGYTNGTYKYRAKPGQPQNLTTVPQANLTGA